MMRPWQQNATATSGVARIILVAILLALATSAGRLAAQAPVAPQAAPTYAAAAATPMDEPLRLLAEARQSYQGVRDYVCLFIKQERLRGRLQPENVIDMKVRTQPFSVYLRWLSPASSAGQEACYVAGRNNGQMRVHSTGLAGVVGFVSLDPRDPRATQNSRHTITEAGIGNLLDRYVERWSYERQLNRTQVQVAEYSYNQRTCVRVEMIHPDRNAGQFAAYRSVVYFDKSTHLPIRIENYDWPAAGGTSGGDLLESYSYANLRLNVGLNETVFAH